MAGPEGRGGADVVAAAAAAPRGVLRQGRAFLDFFWDIAKPEQEVRLAATESLLRHLRDGGKAEELEYALRRLVEGLGATREAARPGFSLALAQMSSSSLWRTHAGAGGCAQRRPGLCGKPTLEQFGKSCSLWKDSTLEKFLENCLIFMLQTLIFRTQILIYKCHPCF